MLPPPVYSPDEVAYAILEAAARPLRDVYVGGSGKAVSALYQYAPRERPAMPDQDGLPARLLASRAFETCFWVPYPHQNVGALARAVEDWPAWLAALARTADLPPPDLPSFGPFAVPPSSEVTACSDSGGDRLLVAAEVYPSIALIAKLAGRLAGNPWLSGGVVERGGRRARRGLITAVRRRAGGA